MTQLFLQGMYHYYHQPATLPTTQPLCYYAVFSFFHFKLLYHSTALARTLLFAIIEFIHCSSRSNPATVKVALRCCLSYGSSTYPLDAIAKTCISLLDSICYNQTLLPISQSSAIVVDIDRFWLQASF
jgi:hypothetical protein